MSYSSRPDESPPIWDLPPKFCRLCAAPLAEKFIELEGRKRMACTNCDYVSYVNPAVVAGTVPVTSDGKIVLLRRGFPPAQGLWSFPAGFMEMGETVQNAARRETQEETGAIVELTKLVGLFSYQESRVVVAVYAAKVVGGTIAATREAPEIRLFDPQDLPWDSLAFQSIQDALTAFLEQSKI